MSFDVALAELERTVAELESGGQPLERTIALYERGVALQQRCEPCSAMPSCASAASWTGARGAVAEAELELPDDA